MLLRIKRSALGVFWNRIGFPIRTGERQVPVLSVRNIPIRRVLIMLVQELLRNGRVGVVFALGLRRCRGVGRFRAGNHAYGTGIRFSERR